MECGDLSPLLIENFGDLEELRSVLIAQSWQEPTPLSWRGLSSLRQNFNSRALSEVCRRLDSLRHNIIMQRRQAPAWRL
jgi:hypothetical protein